MSAQALTVMSGIVLLAVFALVGWYARRRDRFREREGPRPGGRESR